jgi:hypothetical protein
MACLVVVSILFFGAPPQDAPKPLVLDITLKNVDAKQLLSSMGVAEPVRNFINGKIGEIRITLNGDDFTITASKFRLQFDPISRIDVKGNLKQNTLVVKVYALGGLLEYEGKIPKQVLNSLPLRLLRRK